MSYKGRKVRGVLTGAAIGVVLTGMIQMGFAACSRNGGVGVLAPGITEDGRQGTPSEKETYAASLITRSDNTLSSQEKERVLKEISDELDYIMNVVQSLEIADDEALDLPEEDMKGG
jgi:3-hydroxyacyl-CoA dehydrogenase